MHQYKYKKSYIHIFKNFLLKILRIKNSPISSSNRLSFFALTPVNSADEDMVYEIALNQALKDHDVKNIAITGSYGAGKSSIIKTFFHNNGKLKPAYISLGTFHSQGGTLAKQKLQLIERSILQQLFYSVPQASLPLSRFKRITDPSEYIIFQYVVLLGIFSFQIWCHLHGGNPILRIPFEGEVFAIPMASWYSIFNIASVTIIGIYLMTQISKSALSLSELKMNIHSAEITVKNSANASVLNDHLDEILYFFQRTKTTIVVFEDLDRFKSAEIFIRLRELNSILNFNGRASSPIRFIYAVRDDLFSNKDRTKFFDFIIPIIPIVSPTNAYDLVRQDYPHLVKFDNNFLRQICLFFDDLRLLRNIFNEFQIYSEKQKGLHLDPSKLLGLIVYKNYHPDDFSNLHCNVSKVFKIFNTWKIETIAAITVQLNNELSKLNLKISSSGAEQEILVKNLNLLYGAEVLRKSLESHSNPNLVVKSNGEIFSINQLLDGSSTETISRASKFTVHQSGNTQYAVSTIDFSEIENAIDKSKSYEQRLDDVKLKSESRSKKALEKVTDIRDKLDKINRLTIREILIDWPTVSFPNDQSELLNYLLREGYIDETYLDYVSLFFPSLITQADKNFILKIMGRKLPEFDYHLDKIDAILEFYLSEENLSVKTVLNFCLADYFVSGENRHHKHRSAFINLISDESDSSIQFNRSYIRRGANLDQYLPVLANFWKSFLKYFIDCNDEDIIQKCLPFIEKIPDCAESTNALQTYLSYKSAPIEFLKNAMGDDDNKIKELLLLIRPTFWNLDCPPNSTDLLNSIAESEFYVFNQENVVLLININQPDEQKLTSLGTSPFSRIKASKIEYLSKQMNKNLQVAVDFLLPKEQLDEPEEIVLKLLNGNIDENAKNKIILTCGTRVIDLNKVRDKSRWKMLLDNNKIEPKWKNIIAYLLNEECGPDTSLANFINIENHFMSLSKDTIDLDSASANDNWSNAWDVLVGWDELTDEAYEKLLSCFEFVLEDPVNDISSGKILSLINHKCFAVTTSIIEFLSDVPEVFEIYLLMMAQEISESDEASFQHLSIDDLEYLITSDIAIEIKRNLLIRINVTMIEDSEIIQNAIPEIFLGKKVPENLFNTLFSNLLRTDRAVQLLTTQIPYIDKEEVILKTGLLNEELRELFDNLRSKNVIYSEVNFALANALWTAGLCEKPDIIDDKKSQAKFRFKPLKKAPREAAG